MSSKATRAAVYMADRDRGMSYPQIAAKHGVSRQRWHRLVLSIAPDISARTRRSR